MKIAPKYFDPDRTMIVVECACGITFLHRARRLSVSCQACGAEEDLAVLLDQMIADLDRKRG